MNKSDEKDKQIPDLPNSAQDESWDDFNRLLWKLVNEVDVSKIQLPEVENGDEPNPTSNLRKKDCLSFERCSEICEKKTSLSIAEDLHLKNCHYCQKRIETFTEHFPAALVQNFSETSQTPKQTWLQIIKNAFAQNWTALKFASAGLLIILIVGLLFFLLNSNPLQAEKNLANANSLESHTTNNQSVETSNKRPVIITQNSSNLDKIPANLNENKINETPKDTEFTAEIAFLQTAEREAVRQSLESGKIKVSEDLALLQESIVRRKKAQNIQPLSPKNEATIQSQPIIRWQNQEEAEYKVEIFDRELNKVAESEILTQNSWQINKKIAAGFYFWQLSVRKTKAEEFKTSDKVFFKIISETEKARLEKAKKSTKSNLVKAVIYARIGLLTEARRELNIELQRNPSSAKARKMLSQINGWQNK